MDYSTARKFETQNGINSHGLPRVSEWSDDYEGI